MSLKIFNKFLKDKKSVNLDEQLVLSLRGSRIPNAKQLKYLKDYLNKGEKKIIFFSLIFLFISAVFLSARFYTKHLESIPVVGGRYVEAVVGTPKYINPLYSSINDVDADLVALLYSSMFKYDKDGKLINDLVESYQLSEDGKTYNFKIKNGVLWHNDAILTANDVLFTFNAIKDGAYKSPLRQTFQGAQAEVVDDFTIKFQLKEPFSGFKNLLTFGILPSDLWDQIAPNAVSLTELNLKPIGSGLYKLKSLIKDESGNIKALNLQLNTDYYAKKSLVSELRFEFYPSYEEAQAVLNNGLVDGLGFYNNQFKLDDVSKGFLNYQEDPTTQTKALIFNNKSQTGKSLAIRQAIASLIDRSAIIGAIGVSASSIDAPILNQNELYSATYKKYGYNEIEAKKIIEKDEWKLIDVTPADIQSADALIKSGDAKKIVLGQNYKDLGVGKWYFKNNNFLIIKITAADSEENVKIIEQITKDLLRVQIRVIANLVPAQQIQSDVIKNRDYDLLLTGIELSPDADPFLYWHSTQTGADGLNLANFENKDVDKLLEEARSTSDINKRKEMYAKFLNIFANYEPAIYLFTTNYEYVQNKKIRNNNPTFIYKPSNRFSDIENWYISIGRRFKW